MDFVEILNVFSGSGISSTVHEYTESNNLVPPKSPKMPPNEVPSPAVHSGQP